MAHPVYVLLPEGVEWTAVPGTRAQAPSPVRWYLRRSMPDAVTQTAVLITAEGAELEDRLDVVVGQARLLGGVAVDGHTQELIDPDRVGLPR